VLNAVFCLHFQLNVSLMDTKRISPIGGEMMQYGLVAQSSHVTALRSRVRALGSPQHD
jgi:hypothetical protein